MNTYRKCGLITGLLFLGATASGALAFVGDVPDLLSHLATQEPAVLFSGLMILTMGFCGAGVGIGMYPVLREQSPGLAPGAAYFRIMEGMFHCLSAACVMLLVAASRSFSAVPGQTAPFVATLLFETRSILLSGMGVLSWCVGACGGYWLFYRARLVPRWLSLWGIVGLAPAAVAAILFLLRIVADKMPIHALLNLPIGLQEMVLAVWLIVGQFMCGLPCT